MLWNRTGKSADDHSNSVSNTIGKARHRWDNILSHKMKRKENNLTKETIDPQLDIKLKTCIVSG
jgi:hypothetical protein